VADLFVGAVVLGGSCVALVLVLTWYFCETEDS